MLNTSTWIDMDKLLDTKFDFWKLNMEDVHVENDLQGVLYISKPTNTSQED